MSSAVGDGAPASSQEGDDAFLDRLQHTAFDYFLANVNPANGLVADASREGAPCSIAVVGLALAAYAVGVERGWMERALAVRRTLTCLRFFIGSDQSGSPTATGQRGFYFHFLDMQAGTRVWKSELSFIDTTFLVAGMLAGAAYFTADDPDETELRRLATALYERIDWRWTQPEGGTVMQGWKPESGFLHYGWEGYSESLLLYVLGLGSPTHALTPQAYVAWTRTFQWEHLYGLDFLYAGPLFIHQFSHAWIDFRGIRDEFMREKGCDYFENSRRATLIQREYAMRNPKGYAGYGENTWGLSAGEGPSATPRLIDGRRQAFYGYAARGVPYGPDDGTLCGSALVSSVAFTPDIVLTALRAMAAEHIHASGYNRSVGADGVWVSEGRFGLDQGMIVLMVENHRSGLPWRLMRSVDPVRAGLQRAGFNGGWL